ncbi:unnamed protein product [Rotaria magnacalcarata]|uniref:LEM domain-containing protein n=1 Tax=Rotaria magnacalcarata TaxID=392030 RepID=A0A816THK6_9BILA|nr:unnamed protein product [Rotaria magnacalcarata]
MALTDQQLRQELISYGEAVPPITQRNREQLRTRLEALRSQTRTRTAASPSRVQATASPSRAQTNGSPSRSQIATASPLRSTRATASPSKPLTGAPPARATASPSKPLTSAASPVRATASPARALATSSPSRTRSSTTNITVASRQSTRSKQPTNLIELSDSETDSALMTALALRSTRSDPTTPKVQTRSTGSRRQQDSPSTSSSISEISPPPNITNDVEQSIARHRREIKQLLDSARDRNRAANTSASISAELSGTPIRPPSKVYIDTQPEKVDDQVKQSPKPSTEKRKTSSLCICTGKPFRSLWHTCTNLPFNPLKLLLVTLALLSGIIFLANNHQDIFPRQRDINCSVKNATICEDMKQIIAEVQKQLRIRTGEVDCGIRAKSDVFVTKNDIEQHLDEKRLKFNLGDVERWNALVTFILNKPVNDILMWNGKVQTKDLSNVTALSTKEALRSIACRAQQDIGKTTRNLILLIIGSIGLLTLAWYLQKKSKAHEENEEKYYNLLENVNKLLEEQHEKYLRDPKIQPWLAINQIREKLISEKDQEKLKDTWERVKKQIDSEKSQVTSESQDVNGEIVDVWRWEKASPMKTRSKTAKKSTEETTAFITSEVGLTECLKLRNCFRTDKYTGDKEIDHITKAIRNRCAHMKEIEHIGINAAFVYIKLASKEAAGHAYDLLNNWIFEDRTISVKYIRHSRYNEHFPEARNASQKK